MKNMLTVLPLIMLVFASCTKEPIEEVRAIEPRQFEFVGNYEDPNGLALEINEVVAYYKTNKYVYEKENDSTIKLNPYLRLKAFGKDGIEMVGRENHNLFKRIP